MTLTIYVLYVCKMHSLMIEYICNDRMNMLKSIKYNYIQFNMYIKKDTWKIEKKIK